MHQESLTHTRVEGWLVASTLSRWHHCLTLHEQLDQATAAVDEESLASLDQSDIMYLTEKRMV